MDDDLNNDIDIELFKAHLSYAVYKNKDFSSWGLRERIYFVLGKSYQASKYAKVNLRLLADLTGFELGTECDFIYETGHGTDPHDKLLRQLLTRTIHVNVVVPTGWFTDYRERMSSARLARKRVFEKIRGNIKRSSL